LAQITLWGLPLMNEISENLANQNNVSSYDVKGNKSNNFTHMWPNSERWSQHWMTSDSNTKQNVVLIYIDFMLTQREELLWLAEMLTGLNYYVGSVGNLKLKAFEVFRSRVQINFYCIKFLFKRKFFSINFSSLQRKFY
jgi:hypothetical protein